MPEAEKRGKSEPVKDQAPPKPDLFVKDHKEKPIKKQQAQAEPDVLVEDSPHTGL